MILKVLRWFILFAIISSNNLSKVKCCVNKVQTDSISQKLTTEKIFLKNDSIWYDIEMIDSSLEFNIIFNCNNTIIKEKCDSLKGPMDSEFVFKSISVENCIYLTSIHAIQVYGQVEFCANVWLLDGINCHIEKQKSNVKFLNISMEEYSKEDWFVDFKLALKENNLILHVTSLESNIKIKLKELR